MVCQVVRLGRGGAGRERGAAKSACVDSHRKAMEQCRCTLQYPDTGVDKACYKFTLQSST